VVRLAHGGAVASLNCLYRAGTMPQGVEIACTMAKKG